MSRTGSAHTLSRQATVEETAGVVCVSTFQARAAAITVLYLILPRALAASF